jgi:glycerophosphoryl diester phosphodiesterase
MNWRDVYAQGTLVFGHRGASAYAPMNTLPAFELALQQGADGIELDVHLSGDNQLIVLHDFTVDHTTDGTGPAKLMTLAELKQLDAGYKFGEPFRGTRIPTLDEVFAAVGGKLLINVEIKSITEDTDGVEQVTADCIQRHGLASSVIVSSFNPLALKRFRTILPEVAIGYLYEPDYIFFPEVMESLPHEALHPYYETIDAALVERAREAGQVINTWTVNEPAQAVKLRDLGVQGIITDKPDVIRQALA